MRTLCAQCVKNAVLLIEYGTEEGDRTRGNNPLAEKLCLFHATELFERLRPNIKSGYIRWKNTEL